MKVEYVEEHATTGEARRREAQVKRWSAGKKEALIRGDNNALHELAKSHDHLTDKQDDL